jgi:hypothetical protein
MNLSMVVAGNIDRGKVALKEDANALSAAGAGARCCGSKDQYRRDSVHLAPNALLLPGLGCASVSRNGDSVIELQGCAGEHAMTVEDAERFALAEPEQEWCIHIVSLLDDRHYRREGAGLWRLYARGYGLS